VSSLEELVRKENYDLVIPCSDRMLLPLHHNRHRFVGLTRLAIPATDHTDILFDKLRTRELAASLGINLAHSIRPNQSFDAAEVFTRLGAPVVVKPRCSVRATVLQRQEQVRIVATPEELGAAIAGREPSGYFFEAFFPGTGLGLSVLADRGVILQSFQHHRVHQAPRGGSSAYRVSAPIHGDLFAACRKVISHLNYTGVAMFEFRRDSATGNWVLLEVNARPWGSMPLPVALGVDFPFAWYQLLTTSERVPQQSYRAGIYGRNLELDIDFAAKHHFQYVLFDAGWYGAEFRTVSDPTAPIAAIDLPAVIRHGKEKGIGIILYVNYVGLRAHLDTILPLYKKWGVAGLKFGFVDGLTQQGIRWLAGAIRKVSEQGLLLDIHDNYKPTGLSRRWPALLTQEGIRGDENSPDAVHTTTLPFTRFLAGPADFTFCYPNARYSFSKNLRVSKAQQLALTVIYFSPLQSIFWYGNPNDYTDERDIEFFDLVPTVWNESHYLSGAIGKFISVARRKGDTWFIGSAAGPEGYVDSIRFDFLASGRSYDATVYEDDGHGGIVKRTRICRKGDVWKFELPAAGGQALILR